MEWLIGLIILLLISWYGLYNLLRKVEKAEDIITYQNSYISEFQKVIKASDEKLQEIDAKEMFKSDDEIGWFFENVKYIQEQLNQFYNK